MIWTKYMNKKVFFKAEIKRQYFFFFFVLSISALTKTFHMADVYILDSIQDRVITEFIKIKKNAGLL